MGPKTALVLSAGGMFGAYQAGAWRALAGVVHPDIVVGVSVGALNAWAIAGGAEPEDLVRRWLDPACARLATIRPWRRPFGGIFDPQPLYSRIDGLWKASRPRVEIGVVAVELGRLRARLFRNDEITPRHLAASCAVLLGYPQVRLGTKLYTDGGLLNALPLWAAAEMGAERIIAVHALPEMPSRLVRTAVAGFRALAPPSPPRPLGIETRIISPGRRLGSLSQALFWDEAAVRRWIGQGEADARGGLGSP